MSSARSSVSLFKSSVSEEQDIFINCPFHNSCVVFSICAVENCEYGHFICPKCSIERPEHIITHKHHIELVRDFVHRSFLTDFIKDADFKPWEQDVDRKMNEIQTMLDNFEKTFDETINRKVSLLQEKIVKQIQGLQDNFKSAISNSEAINIQDLKKRINLLKARANVEKVLGIISKSRSFDAERNRKEIQSTLDAILQETIETTNINALSTPIDSLVSGIALHISNIFTKLNLLLKSSGSTLNDICQEITRQNSLLDIDMNKSNLKKSNQSVSVSLSNYSSNSAIQQKSQDNIRESVDKIYLNPLEKEKTSLFYKQKDEIKLSSTDGKSDPGMTESRKSQKESASILFLYTACEEKINLMQTSGSKAAPTYEEIKNYIESYNKKNSRDNVQIFSFYGETRDGKKEGLGVDVQTEFVYIGQYKNDLPNGKGKIIFKNDDFFDGEWVNGKFEGKGKFSVKSAGTTYVGQFSQGLKNGFGSEERSDGSKYEGYFKDGQKHGKGVYKWAFGESYEGEFIENKMHGKGTYVWNDGTVYVGEWKENKLSGNGLLVEGNGGRYLGSFKNDKKEGYGIYTWSDGWVYRGKWQNGLQSGIGTEIDPRGTSRVCQWKDGNVVKYLV